MLYYTLMLPRHFERYVTLYYADQVTSPLPFLLLPPLCTCRLDNSSNSGRSIVAVAPRNSMFDPPASSVLQMSEIWRLIGKKSRYPKPPSPIGVQSTAGASAAAGPYYVCSRLNILATRISSPSPVSHQWRAGCCHFNSRFDHAASRAHSRSPYELPSSGVLIAICLFFSASQVPELSPPIKSHLAVSACISCFLHSRTRLLVHSEWLLFLSSLFCTYKLQHSSWCLA